MEILGIGPGEFLLILIVLLVAVGPERLPGLARQAGRTLVRARNWLQTSPDAALILRARKEIEQELATLRSSLLEVQSVRDEVLGAAKQLEDSVGSLASTRISLDEPRTIAPPSAATSPEALPSPAADAAPATEEAPVTPSPELPPAQPAPQVRLDQWSVARQPAPVPANGTAAPAQGDARAAAALEAIELQLQAIMADLHALQAQLKQRGVLDDDWEPPSWGMSIAGAAGEAGAASGGAEEPIATEEAAR
jgi:sec-independent protein translocase protein TatB